VCIYRTIYMLYMHYMYVCTPYRHVLTTQDLCILCIYHQQSISPIRGPIFLNTTYLLYIQYYNIANIFNYQMISFIIRPSCIFFRMVSTVIYQYIYLRDDIRSNGLLDYLFWSRQIYRITCITVLYESLY
jgi:hypothetical protein